MSGQNSDDENFYTEPVGTRLSPQTKEAFEDYAERNELSNSEALRRLLRSSLEPDRNAGLLGAGVMAGALWVALIATGRPTAAALVGGAFIAVALAWAVWPQLRHRVR